MKKTTILSFGILVIFCLTFITACNLPASDSTGLSNEDYEGTAVAQTLNPQEVLVGEETTVAERVSLTQTAAAATEQMNNPQPEATATNSPTETPEPSITPTVDVSATPTTSPTATANPNSPKADLGSPDFMDDFDNKNYWTLFNEGNFKSKIEDGQYIMTVKTSWNLWEVTVPSIEDFYLEVTATTPANCEGKDHYGLIFRAPNPSEGYIFDVSCDGSWQFWKYTNDKGEYLIDWTSNSAILTGGNKTNVIGVKANGDEFNFYVNGKLVGTVTDDEFSKGNYGLTAGAPKSENLTVNFDKLGYWLLP